MPPNETLSYRPLWMLSTAGANYLEENWSDCEKSSLGWAVRIPQSTQDFKQHVQHATVKASAVVAVLSRLMSNLGKPKQKSRVLLSSVVPSVLTHGISIWIDAILYQEIQRKVDTVLRRSALRIISAFRTLSQVVGHVIAGSMPIDVWQKSRRPSAKPNIAY